MAIIDLYKTSIYKNLSQPKYGEDQTRADHGISLKNDKTALQISDKHIDRMPKIRSQLWGNSIIQLRPNDSARKNTYNNRLNYSLTSIKKVANFMISNKGIWNAVTQFILQSFNPQIETKVWNPLSVFSNTIPFLGYHERRHIWLGADTYSKSVLSEPFQSRNYFQAISPAPLSEKSGLDYANAGRDVMTNPTTWSLLNPNRYRYPIGADGGGIPLSSVTSPSDELMLNIGLAQQGFRYTKASGFNPSLDSQITAYKNAGSNFLTDLLKNIPYSGMLLRLFGYGILPGSSKIKIFNKYNVTYSYFSKGFIRIVDDEGKELQTYKIKEGDSPIIDILRNGIEKMINMKATEDMPFTFTDNIIDFVPKSPSGIGQLEGQTGTAVDDRLIKSPFDGKNKITNYIQTFGNILSKYKSDVEGTVDIDNNGVSITGNAMSYSKQIYDKSNDKTAPHIIYSYGFARPGAHRKDDRQIDLINALPYGKDYSDVESGNEYREDYGDLIPFKFYHINTGKWIVFRANLTGISDSITPTWNSKEYIGRADKVYTYKGADRKINFNFTINPMSPAELKPLWMKLNYLIGLNYPVYRKFSGIGQYLEAPFIKLTIGDMFENVPGIIDGGVTITVDDDSTWETRLKGIDSDGNDIARLPRLIRVTIGSFTPFGIDNNPLSSVSPYYSIIKKWQDDQKKE